MKSKGHKNRNSTFRMSAYSFQKILLLFCDGNPKASDSRLCLIKVAPKAACDSENCSESRL
jgi:hypothetical protein